MIGMMRLKLWLSRLNMVDVVFCLVCFWILNMLMYVMVVLMVLFEIFEEICSSGSRCFMRVLLMKSCSVLFFLIDCSV